MIIDHGLNLAGNRIMTLYAHLSDNQLPSYGNYLRAGDTVGLVGSFGENAARGVGWTGPHLHQETLAIKPGESYADRCGFARRVAGVRCTNLPMRTTGFMRYDPATFTDYPSGNVYSVPTQLIPLPRARPNGLGVENSGPPTSITDNPDGTLRLQFAPDDQGFWNQLTTDAFGRILSSITRNQSNAVAQQTIFTDGHGAKQTVYNVGNDNLWSQRQILYSGSADAVVADFRDYTTFQTSGSPITRSRREPVAGGRGLRH